MLLVGIGRSGGAEQHISAMVDPAPAAQLSAFGGSGRRRHQLTYDTLRASGNISANSVTASSSLVDGDVEAVIISGSTFDEHDHQIDADELPTMPDWSTLVDEYQNIGTEISIASLPNSTPNLCLNSGSK